MNSPSLVERLREQIENEDEFQQFGSPMFGYGNIFREAAARIETLEADLTEAYAVISEVATLSNPDWRDGSRPAKLRQVHAAISEVIVKVLRARTALTEEPRP